jgi:hypothetical protein
VLTTPARRDMAEEALGGTIPVWTAQDIIATTAPAPLPVRSPGSLALLQYTSGSTGTPKGTMITLAAMAANAEQIRHRFRHSPETVLVSWLPMFHDMGLVGGLMQPLHVGFGGSGYGVDLIAVNGWGLRASGIMPEDPAGYLIFGMPVLAPCAGRVVLAEGGHPDMAVPQMEEGHPEGNYLLLRCGDHDILLAHFRQGSLRVAVGDNLAIGQQIAEVGNSGESSEPHLHIHAQLPGTSDAPFGGLPVPMRLEGRFLVRGDLVQAGARGQ